LILCKRITAGEIYENTLIENLSRKRAVLENRIAKTFLLTLFFAASSLICPAQVKEDETISVGTELVSINVSVTDSKNRLISGLTKEQFEIFDDKVKQEIAFFSGEESPLSMGIIYDVHSSSTERTDAVLKSLKDLSLHFDRKMIFS
jgi:hypothetical protein